MSRPTISLCLIVKNEKENLPRLLESVRGCFDAVHITDTGSTDGTIELITEAHRDNRFGVPLFLHAFKWIDDFAAARQFSFDQADTDYIMWMDADDTLSSAADFIRWRDGLMSISPLWVASYNYALHPETKKPVCVFARERVIKRNSGMHWKYFVHEGLISPPEKPVTGMFTAAWTVDHQRTADDLKKDRSRNIRLFKANEESLDARMQYYYGKELWENQEPNEALKWLTKSVQNKSLEQHDRLLAIQYACSAAQVCGQFDMSIAMAHSGLQLAPTRAEFWCIIGDSFLKKRQFAEAIPYFQAARSCAQANPENNGPSAIYRENSMYTTYPRNQLARLYVMLNDFGRARECLTETKMLYPNAETEALMKEVDNLQSTIDSTLVPVLQKSEDIIISCHPNGFYEWDEEIYKERGIGGSETAVVEMARNLHERTHRKVLIYNNRTESKVFDGVEYHPATKIYEYLSKYIPHTHIAWRHNLKLTNAPTYVWNHDLGFPGLENQAHYDKVLCLSEFHKSFVMSTFGIPESRVLVTRNGLNISRFDGLEFTKTRGKVVFSSSPDRGLDRAILVMDRVREEVPWASLHVYYGFDNMMKNGREADVRRMQAMIADRPWITYHGNIEQRELAKELSQAEVWLYPTSFLETSCQTAMEMAMCRVFPVVRRFGALIDTLPSILEPHMYSMLDSDCDSDEARKEYAKAVVSAIKEERHICMKTNASYLSWQTVAGEWEELLSISALPSVSDPSALQ